MKKKIIICMLMFGMQFLSVFADKVVELPCFDTFALLETTQVLESLVFKKYKNKKNSAEESEFLKTVARVVQKYQEAREALLQNQEDIELGAQLAFLEGILEDLHKTSGAVMRSWNSSDSDKDESIEELLRVLSVARAVAEGEGGDSPGGIAGLLKDLPDLARGVVAVLVICAACYGGWKFYRWLSIDNKTLYDEVKKLADTAGDLERQIGDVRTGISTISESMRSLAKSMQQQEAQSTQASRAMLERIEQNSHAAEAAEDRIDEVIDVVDDCLGEVAAQLPNDILSREKLRGKKKRGRLRRFFSCLFGCCGSDLALQAGGFEQLPEMPARGFTEQGQPLKRAQRNWTKLRAVVRAGNAFSRLAQRRQELKALKRKDPSVVVMGFNEFIESKE
jgi:hypothetical protein